MFLHKSFITGKFTLILRLTQHTIETGEQKVPMYERKKETTCTGQTSFYNVQIKIKIKQSIRISALICFLVTQV